MLGKVKMFNKEKGYGFIKNEEGKDIFFHYSQLVMPGFKNVEEGASVEFTPVDTERGMQAQHIIKL